MFLWPYHLNAIFSFIVYSLQSLPCQLLLVTWGGTMGLTVEILYLLRENDLGAINNNKCLIHHLTLQTWVSQFFLFLDSNLMKRDNSALLCDVFKTLCWRWLRPRRRSCCVTSWSACSCFWTPAPRPHACPRPRPRPGRSLSAGSPSPRGWCRPPPAATARTSRSPRSRLSHSWTRDWIESWSYNTAVYPDGQIIFIWWRTVQAISLNCPDGLYQILMSITLYARANHHTTHNNFNVKSMTNVSFSWLPVY